MFDIATIAYAQDAVAVAGKQPGIWQGLQSFAPLFLIFIVFYFFIIRPQQKKLSEHQNLLNSLTKGDQIITSSGILGSIIKVEEQDGLLVLEIADQVRIKIRKEAVAEVLNQKKAA